jgi:hypothetical protein
MPAIAFGRSTELKAGYQAGRLAGRVSTTSMTGPNSTAALVMAITDQV